MRGAAFLEAVWGVLGGVVLASVLPAASSIEVLDKAWLHSVRNRRHARL